MLIYQYKWGVYMQILVLGNNKDKDFYRNSKADGYIFPLDGYSMDYEVKFTIEEIELLRNKKKKCFIIINRMFFEEDIEELDKLLLKIDNYNIDGILYYDDALLELKIRNNYKTNLYINKNYMMCNSDTINFYHHYGVRGVVLSNEITLGEINDIRNNTSLEIMQLLIGYPVVASSRRSLVTNSGNKEKIEVVEPKSKQHYKIIEDEFGSSFISLKRFNGCRYLDDFKSIEYGIIYQDDLSIDIINRLIENIKTNNIKEIDELVGRNRGFLNRKTIYKVIR